MLERDRNDLFDGIDTTKIKLVSRECSLRGFWYSIEQNFKYQKYLCNGCHDLMQKAMSFNNAAIVSVKANDYRIHFWHMNKDDVIIIIRNSKKRHIVTFFIYIFFYI